RPVGRMCRHPFGCSKRASFGEASSRLPLYCLDHKMPQHINVNSRMCHYPECKRQPLFGDACDGVPRFCGEHRRKSDLDLVHSRCSFDGCVSIPWYGEVGKSPQYCSKHKRRNMVNL
ncbi:hypothetical protein GUITHDRAFT_46831, partial [Guillardia theta CCMP2712]